MLQDSVNEPSLLNMNEQLNLLLIPLRGYVAISTPGRDKNHKSAPNLCIALPPPISSALPIDVDFYKGTASLGLRTLGGLSFLEQSLLLSRLSGSMSCYTRQCRQRQSPWSVSYLSRDVISGNSLAAT